MLEKDYENQEVLKILKDFSKNEQIEFNYCKLYELLESHLL